MKYHKIEMTTPIVEMDGDEMTRILWSMIKDTLILPYVELKSEYYDLSLLSRNETDDQVTVAAAEATKKYGVAVKCATITPNHQRMVEYPQLKKMWRSPNATIRSIIGGTIFRTPIVVPNIQPAVRSWKKPITIARHAYGDIYSAVEFSQDGGGKCTLSFSAPGTDDALVVHESDEPCIFLAQHNKLSSIRSFAQACMQFAIDTRQNLLFSAKDTVSKTYDGTFRAIFAQEYEKCKDLFDKNGISYQYTLIDDAVARIMRSEGGVIWACKNYDGDVMSDMVSSAFGSLAMMSSVLVSPNHVYEFEAAHGTVTRHYYKHLAGEETSTNPIATIFAWTGALKKRGEFDSLPDLVRFGTIIEDAVLCTVSRGIVTKDLAPLLLNSPTIVSTKEFLAAVVENAHADLSQLCSGKDCK